MWFIGLEFKKISGGVNITLTYEIQVFTNAGQSIVDSTVYYACTCGMA